MHVTDLSAGLKLAEKVQYRNVHRSYSIRTNWQNRQVSFLRPYV